MWLSWGTGVQPNARAEVLGPGVPDMLGEDDVLDIGREGGVELGVHILELWSHGPLVPLTTCPKANFPSGPTYCWRLRF